MAMAVAVAVVVRDNSRKGNPSIRRSLYLPDEPVMLYSTGVVWVSGVVGVA